MGDLLGNAVRFDGAGDVMAAGEGIETVLSLLCVLPAMPMVAALSAAHLSAILFPLRLRRLYIISDNDAAGEGAAASLIARARAAGIEVIVLSPTLDDFNEDLRRLGVDELRAAIVPQLAWEDVADVAWVPCCLAGVQRFSAGRAGVKKSMSSGPTRSASS